MKTPRLTVIFLIGLLAVHCVAQSSAASASQGSASTAQADLGLIPKPRGVEARSGSFPITATTRIVMRSSEERAAADAIADEIESATGRRPRVATGSAAAGAIFLTRLDAAQFPTEAAQDGNFKAEGYVLDIAHDRITIAGATPAGTFYGAQTLRQLVRPTGKQAYGVAAVHIVDWPALRWRGLHKDISRGPVSTLDAIKQQIRTLAEYKYNLYALYMEHVYDYQSQPLMAPREGSLNAAEIKEIVDYAQRYYITVLPEQQAFGHLHHLLKYELYQDIAETPHGHVLTPTNPKSYDLIKSLYAELAPLVPGPFFHIGSDETWELGQGQTRDRAQQVGLGRVYLEHLQKVYELMKPYHKRLLFWGDIAEKYPELLGILPKDMIAVAWDYGAKPDFTRRIKPFRDAGLEVWISPGANNWVHIWPELNAAFVNIRNFVRDGQRFGATGMLNTTWDDDGEALFSMTWPAVVFGADCGWQQGECSIERFADAYDWSFYRNPDHTFRDAIQSLNHTHTLLAGAFLGFASNDMFWQDPFTPSGARFIAQSLPVMHDLRLDAEHALVALATNSNKARLHADTLGSMQLAAMRLDLLGMKVQFAREMSNYYWDAYTNQADRGRTNRDLSEISATNGRLQDLRDATERTRIFYEQQWLKENRPYWLRNVLIRYDELAGLFQRKIYELDQSEAAYRVSGTLAPPEQLGFYSAPALPPPPRPAIPAAAPAPAANAPASQPNAAPALNTPPASPSTEAEVMQVLQRQADAGLRRDVAALDAVLDAEYFHTNPDGSTMSRAETLASYTRPTQFTFSRSEFEDVKTIVTGDTAIVNARMALTGKRGDDPFTSRYRVTYVLRRRPEGWKVLNSHSSLLGITPGAQ